MSIRWQERRLRRHRRRMARLGQGPSVTMIVTTWTLMLAAGILIGYVASVWWSR